jgi:hypothetical protein
MSVYQVAVHLVCRCGNAVDRVIALPADVAPPTSFVCSNCTAGISMTDGRSETDLKTTELARRVHREGRSTSVIPGDQEESAMDRWRRRNPVWGRVYRQLHRAGYRRPKQIKHHPPPEDVMTEWFRRVVEFGWTCADCKGALTQETVHCWRESPGIGHAFQLDECLPLCQICTKRRAARIRWSRENTGHDAAENDSLIHEGQTSAAKLRK